MLLLGIILLMKQHIHLPPCGSHAIFQFASDDDGHPSKRFIRVRELRDARPGKTYNQSHLNSFGRLRLRSFAGPFEHETASLDDRLL